MAKPPPRLFVPGPLGGGPAVGREHALGKDQAHYLGTVLRLGEGAELLLFDGQSGEWRGTITAISRKGAEVALVERTRPQGVGPDLTLLFAPLKKGPTDQVVRQGTELGVRRFVPVLTARTQSERVKTERLTLIATEAAEQCERLDVPRVEEPRPLADALAEAGPVLFCDEAGAAPGGAWGREALPSALDGLRGGVREEAPGWSVLVGPEGGFTPAERTMLRARPRTVTVGLGPRILKAETAAIAALVAWGGALGDL